MTGEIVAVVPTCAVKAVQLKGPIKLSGQQVRGNTKIELSGSGAMSAKITHEDQ
jgi:hypothetical protein